MSWTTYTTPKTVESTYQCEFNGQETISQLRVNFMQRMACWGVSKYLACEPNNGYLKGLMMKVSAHHHKQYVLITLGWDDTYSVYLVNHKKQVICGIDNVYCDQLADVIDDKIERLPNYIN